jgi:AcrR family transcriptional regulator
MPQRQERALRTRARILRAAAEVFDEQGFAAASLSKIVKRAGVTMGAVYFHFSSKEELATAVMAEQAADVTFREGEDGLQRLIDITMELAYQLQKNVLLRAGVRLAVEQGAFGVSDEAAYLLWIERFRKQLTAARDRGELLSQVEPADLARVLVGAYTGTQLLSQISTGRADLPERIAALWRYLLPGIAAPAAIAHLVLPPRIPATSTS